MSSEHAPWSEIVEGNLLCSPSTLCRHFGLLFGERLDTLLTSSDKKISGFTRPHVIGFVADLCFSTLVPSTRYRTRCGSFFSTLESGFIFFGFAVEFAGYVWTVAVSGKKKLRIRKYPDTCGRGLNISITNHQPKDEVNIIFRN